MCGIVAIAGDRNAVRNAVLGLYALQHRGQEAAGVVVDDGERLQARHGLGLVADALSSAQLDGLHGSCAVGHVRYATAGERSLRNAQPLLFDHHRGPLAIAHNGTLTNARALRSALELAGAIFRTDTDSEVVVHLIAHERGPLERAAVRALRKVQGAYSLLLLAPGKLIAVRDPHGFRPLVLGRLGRAHVFASETTALRQLGADIVREVEPGEMLVLEGGRLCSSRPFPKPPHLSCCVFEQIYFARPDSRLFGLSVQSTRRALGRELAKETFGVEADIVVPVPDSGVPSAIGFAEESGIPFELGFTRSHYIGRTFIQPAQGQRISSVNLKLIPVREVLGGRRVVLVDDSIVRGTTSRIICRMLRESGVKEIHMALSSPPVVSPCFYGIDTPRRRELIAARRSLAAMRRFLGVDSLHYLSLEGLRRVVHRDASAPLPPGERAVAASDYCTACFTGRYPTPIPDFRGALR